MNFSDAVAAVCSELYVPMVADVFGSEGVDAAFAVMGAVKALFKHVDPERISGEVVVFARIASVTPSSTSSSAGGPISLATLANRTINDLLLEVMPDGKIYQRAAGSSAPADLSGTSVVYVFRGGTEVFLAGSDRKEVIKLDSAARSQFSVPTFSNLRTALQHYEVENVRESSCYIFSEAWADACRLFLKAGPEWLMRRSLTQFLKNRLGDDHDVWPEQNVDESHPVDIQVIPRFANNRVMLIEIKWLGDSVDDTGHITARHRDSRAQAGATQLADYIDEKRRSAPTSIIHGFYVIVDARRAGLNEGTSAISRANGMQYETADIAFDPAPHSTRQDFDPPYRMFACPVCAD